MSTRWRYIFLSLFFLFLLHFIRDLLQILDIHTQLSDTLKTKHQWCGSFCDYVTLPFELFGIVASFIVLKRNKMGILGKLVFLQLPFWPIGFITEPFLR